MNVINHILPTTPSPGFCHLPSHVNSISMCMLPLRALKWDEIRDGNRLIFSLLIVSCCRIFFSERNEKKKRIRANLEFMLTVDTQKIVSFSYPCCYPGVMVWR